MSEHPLVAELKHRIAYADDFDDPCAGSPLVESTISKIDAALRSTPEAEGTRAEREALIRIADSAWNVRRMLNLNALALLDDADDTAVRNYTDALNDLNDALPLSEDGKWWTAREPASGSTPEAEARVQEHDCGYDCLDGGYRGYQAVCWDCGWRGAEYLRGDEDFDSDEGRSHKRNAKREAAEHRASTRAASTEAGEGEARVHSGVGSTPESARPASDPLLALADELEARAESHRRKVDRTPERSLDEERWIMRHYEAREAAKLARDYASRQPAEARVTKRKPGTRNPTQYRVEPAPPPSREGE